MAVTRADHEQAVHDIGLASGELTARQQANQAETGKIAQENLEALRDHARIQEEEARLQGQIVQSEKKVLEAMEDRQRATAHEVGMMGPREQARLRGSLQRVQSGRANWKDWEALGRMNPEAFDKLHPHTKAEDDITRRLGGFAKLTGDDIEGQRARVVAEQEKARRIVRRCMPCLDSPRASKPWKSLCNTIFTLNWKRTAAKAASMIAGKMNPLVDAMVLKVVQVARRRSNRPSTE